jgi:hypothetical protein
MRKRNTRDGALSGNERERSSREVECIHSQVKKKALAEENERVEEIEQEKDERRNSLM